MTKPNTPLPEGLTKTEYRKLVTMCHALIDYGESFSDKENGARVWNRTPSSEILEVINFVSTALENQKRELAEEVINQHEILTKELGANEYRAGMDFMKSSILALLEKGTE